MRVQNLVAMIVAGFVVASCDKVEFPVIPIDEEFQGPLTGTNEVPSVTTTAAGAIQLALSLDTVLAFRVDVTGIDSTIWARIYSGAAGATGGDTIATLFVGAVACRDANNRPINDASPTCRLSYAGQLGQGQIVPSQLTLPAGYGATPRARFDSVLALMRAGNAYVNVHTKRNPNGELRGQIGVP
jgi:hypothetical protein